MVYLTLENRETETTLVSAYITARLVYIYQRTWTVYTVLKSWYDDISIPSSCTHYGFFLLWVYLNLMGNLAQRRNAKKLNFLGKIRKTRTLTCIISVSCREISLIISTINLFGLFPVWTHFGHQFHRLCHKNSAQYKIYIKRMIFRTYADS